MRKGILAFIKIATYSNGSVFYQPQFITTKSIFFGKENQYADTPGWSDIGGGTDNNESFLETASREGMEELTGFLGMEKDIRSLLTKNGSYKVEFGEPHRRYRVHIFPMKYDPNLPVYYNNNHRFLEKKLSKNLIKNSKIFEKRKSSGFA